MLPFASASKIRLVIVNQRGYPGSSDFTPEELSELNHEDPEVRTVAMKGFGLELAVFLTRLIDIHNIPKPSTHANRRTGGLSVIVWSLGNMTLLSFLAFGHEYPAEIRSVLEEYLHTAIAYGERKSFRSLCVKVSKLSNWHVLLLDSAGSVYGITLPPGLHSPLRDPSMSLERRREEFARWIFCSCDAVKDLDDVTIPLLIEREKNRDPSDNAYDRLSSEDVASVIDFSVFAKYQFIISMPGVFAKITELALYETQGAWKNLKVVAMWCDKSPWVTVWGAKIVSDRIAKGGKDTRNVKFVKLENANHFVSL